MQQLQKYASLYSSVEGEIEIENGLSSVLKRKHEEIDTSFDFIEQEVEIRIESLKNELDELQGTFKERMQNMRTVLKNELASVAKSEECLNVLIQRCEEVKSSVGFCPSIQSVSEELIGKIVQNNRTKETLGNEEIFKRLENSIYETFDLNVKPNDACVLPGNLILTANEGGSLTVFDENFSLIKKVDHLNKKRFEVRGLAVNARSQIYASNISDNSVMLLDLDFNVLKTTAEATKGDKQSKLHRPTSLYCNNVNVYVCDSFNHRIQVYTLDLEFVKSVKLGYYPGAIKVSNSTYAVHCINGTRFYDSKSEDVKTHKRSSGRFSEINSEFFVISKEKIICYSSTGKIVNEIENHRFKSFVSTNLDGSLLVVNKKLIFFSNSENNALKF